MVQVAGQAAPKIRKIELEAFTIICETCAAKLKVRNPALIGQKLSCPKCGTMLLIEAPEGWTPPPEKPPASDSSEPDFEDIDAILKQQPSGSKPVKPIQPVRKKKPDPVSTKQNSRDRQPSAPATDSTPPPILPDDNWTADSTKSTRKWIIGVAGAVGILALAATAVMAIYANRGKHDDVAENAEELPKTEILESADPKVVPETEVAEPVVETAENSETTSAETNPDATVDNPNIENPESVAAEIPATPVETPVPEPPVTTPSETPPPKPKKLASPFDEVFEEIMNSNGTSARTVETNFDELSDALGNAGTTLAEFNQFASVNRRFVGVPKYFVQRNPLARPPKNPLGLALPCAAVQYNGQSLNQIISEIEQITGTHISLDADNLQRVDFDFGVRLDQLLLKEPDTFANVLLSVAGIANDQTTLEYDGGIEPVLITTVDANIPTNLEMPLPDLREMNPDDMARMLRDLIEPDSWGKDNKIVLADGKVTASNVPGPLSQLEVCLQKWELAVGGTDFQSKSSRAQAALDQTIDARFEYATPIREFLAEVEQKTDVNFLIDFQSLSSVGWSPRSMIPANIQEESVGDLLDEICHSMNIVYRVIDENTFELLSTEAEKRHRDLEFYSCKKILAGPLQAEQMIELLRQSLQSAGYTTVDMRAFYAKEIVCFIVVAPQSIQRSIESILKRLEEL